MFGFLVPTSQLLSTFETLANAPDPAGPAFDIATWPEHNVDSQDVEGAIAGYLTRCGAAPNRTRLLDDLLRVKRIAEAVPDEIDTQDGQ